MNRKYFIDNLRSFVILLLFPFHSLRMFTSYRHFYIEGTPFFFADCFTTFCSTWFMSLLFILAGISAYYSIQKRSISTFVKGRFTRLLIPCFSGILLIVPIQSYIAEISKNHYTGSYLEQYRLFFSGKGDMTGYYGGFTPGHLWFLFFLFFISIISLPVIIYQKKKGFSFSFHEKKNSLFQLLLHFLPYSLFGLLEAGEPLGRYLFCFLLGFLLLSHDEILLYLKNKALFFTITGVFSVSLYTAVYLYGFYHRISSPAFSLFSYLLFYFASLTMMYAMSGLGQKYFDFETTITRLFAKNSFSVYYVHQSILVIIGYFMLTCTHQILLQILVTMTASFLCSILCVAVIKKIPGLRFLFGMQ